MQRRQLRAERARWEDEDGEKETVVSLERDGHLYWRSGDTKARSLKRLVVQVSHSRRRWKERWFPPYSSSFEEEVRRRLVDRKGQRVWVITRTRSQETFSLCLWVLMNDLSQMEKRTDLSEKHVGWRRRGRATRFQERVNYCHIFSSLFPDSFSKRRLMIFLPPVFSLLATSSWPDVTGCEMKTTTQGLN